MATTANNNIDTIGFLDATVPMRTEALNSIENVRPQFNLIELYAVMLLWIEILILIAA